MIANLSTKEEALPSQIGLVGSINVADIWLQTDLLVY
jgi:hypothetical protein